MTATKVCKQFETYKTYHAQTAGAASISGGKASPERAAAFTTAEKTTIRYRAAVYKLAEENGRWLKCHR